MNKLMTRPECRNVLVTAWNDSGAGRLMRLMDGADQVFAFPFELLLGAECTLGIQRKPYLVSGKYRWNVFRNLQKIQAVLEQELFSKHIFEPSESELNDWLEKRKFVQLAQYKNRAKSFIDSRSSQSLTQRQLLHTEDVLVYIESMKAIFSDQPVAINLVHSPCAALDCNSSNFWNIFSQVVIVIINPMWGLGNMHRRNQIPPNRYLERWLMIGQASYQLKQQHPEQVLILLSSVDTIKQTENVEKAHDFLRINTIASTTQIPTLLGEDLGDIGFPFGGISRWSLRSFDDSVAEANATLINSDNHSLELLDQCISLYKLFEQ